MCRSEGEVEFFLAMNNTGGPGDVWAIDGVNEDDLVQAPEGFLYLPASIARERLTLLGPMQVPEPIRHISSSAYRSTLTITLGDGTVMRDDAAHAWIQRTSNDRS